MAKKDEALRMAAKAFLMLHFGATMTTDEYKTFADLCALALPMKYRFSNREWEDMQYKARVYGGPRCNNPACEFEEGHQHPCGRKAELSDVVGCKQASAEGVD